MYLNLSSLTRRCSHASDSVECGATRVAQPPRPEAFLIKAKDALIYVEELAVVRVLQLNPSLGVWSAANFLIFVNHAFKPVPVNVTLAMQLCFLDDSKPFK